jgi:hypothetical protein
MGTTGCMMGLEEVASVPSPREVGIKGSRSPMTGNDSRSLDSTTTGTAVTGSRRKWIEGRLAFGRQQEFGHAAH